MQQFSDWLYDTGFSTMLRDTPWAVPGLQTIHILAIAVLAVGALVTNLRLAGAFATDTAATDVVRAYGRGFRIALVVLLLTGSLLIVGEPGRTLGNTTFWLKIGLVISALALTAFAQRSVKTGGEGGQPGIPATARLVAWLCLLIWVAVIFCGRWIAYT